MAAPRTTWRRSGGLALVVVTSLLLAGAAVSGYTRAALVDQQEFSTRAATALDDADVRTVMAEWVVDGLTTGVPDVLAVRPLVVPAIAALADTSPFRRVLRRAVSDRHGALLRGESTFTFELPLDKGLLLGSIRSVSPRVAAAIPSAVRVPVLRLDPRDLELAVARLLADVAGWWWPLLSAAVAAAIASALLAGGARGALVSLGVSAAGAGLLVAAAVVVLGEFAVSHAAVAADLDDETERGAVRALWAALFSDLLTSALVVALGGAVVAALAARALPVSPLGTAGRVARSAVRSPSGAARVARAIVLISLGTALVLEPALTGRIVLVVVGVLLLVTGLAHLSEGSGGRATSEPGRATALVFAGAMAGAMALTVVAVAVVLPAPRAELPEGADSVGACNGSAALCGRRINEAVFPATHNSYAASAERGWLFANQRYGIERQLREGIRALLIDIHYGARDSASGLVRTDLEAEGSSRNKVARELSPEALRVADRVAGRVGVQAPTDDRRPYLCHTLCELGAEPLDEQLQIVEGFLAANRREVIVLFLEPYVPVQEVERSLERNDLLRHAVSLRRDEPLPTLGQLVRLDTRLIVMSEQDGGARPWYLPGFSFTQDTPLGARSGGEFRCTRFRGNSDSPLLLLNHWIDTYPPSPSRNERIGGPVLERRLRRCERDRGMLPNLIAVDFYERTGVVEVVADRNAAR